MKTKTIYSCQSCGYQSAKWLGRCPECESWNSFQEEALIQPSAKSSSQAMINPVSARLLKDVDIEDSARLKTGFLELDRVLGGGIVHGSIILIGGDPGIGKSTLSLQFCIKLAFSGKKVLYVSAEESAAQVKMRAVRIDERAGGGNFYIVNQNDIVSIKESITKISPDIVIIDSIQVIFNPEFESSPGSVGQVRDCAGSLARIAKDTGIAVFIIGHVTKEGFLAGPRVLEHIVDSVLYFEGDRYSSYRLLRAVKNRFGSTNEIGVFEMTQSGLREVDNPSCLFLSERPKDVAGSVVSPVIEGTRSILVEIQALVSRANFGYAARKAEGFDANRLALLIAVLDKKIGMHLETEDVFLNIAGGMKVVDPACDLAVVMAIASSFKDKPVSRDTVFIGEIGLTSEVRSVSLAVQRIKEAEKLGFKRCLLPKSNLKDGSLPRSGIELAGVDNIKAAFDMVFS